MNNFELLEIATEIKAFGQSTSTLFESLHTTTKADRVNPQIDELKEKLFKLTNMVGDLTNNNDEIDKLGDMVEKELSSMDKAIEEVSGPVDFVFASINHCCNFRPLNESSTC